MNIIDKIDKYLNEENFSDKDMSWAEIHRLTSKSLNLNLENWIAEWSFKDKKGFKIEMQHFLYVMNIINHHHFDNKVKRPNPSKSGSTKEWDWDLLGDYLDLIKKTLKDMKKISRKAKGRGTDKVDPYTRNLRKLYELIRNIEENIDVNIKRIDVSDYKRVIK